MLLKRKITGLLTKTNLHFLAKLLKYKNRQQTCTNGFSMLSKYHTTLIKIIVSVKLEKKKKNVPNCEFELLQKLLKIYVLMHAAGRQVFHFSGMCLGVSNLTSHICLRCQVLYIYA